MKQDVKKTKRGTQIVFRCNICGLHYLDMPTAQKCAKWCKEYHSCNLKITSKAIENKKY